MHELDLQRLIALVVFAGTYLGLALGRLPFFRVDRTGVAIIGGAIVVVSGVLPWDRAVAAVDAHTLVLLFGMMIVAAYLRLSGFFRLVTHEAVRRAHTPTGLLGLIIVAAGVLSALFVNDVVCLVMAPIVLDVVRQLRLPPPPYLIALATAANVGSVATLTGNPQNMLVGSFSGISYRAFLLRETPVAAAGLGIVFVVIWFVYRRALPPTLPTAELPESFRLHYPLMIKTIIAVSVMLIAFLAGVPIALVAIGGAAYCLLTRRVNPDKVYREIDWGLLVLFTGLFVVVGGIDATGISGELLGWAATLGLYRPAVLTAVIAVLSNLVSNVPAVLLFKSVIPSFGEPTRAWLLLAMASTLAGNLTILGSVANLIVVEQARGAGIQLGFVEHGRVGIPVTLLTLLVGWLLLIC
ncbi:MAG TPA: anion transporter [Candidatus Bathyarchaeia archaeon]|nr:anion transporter [Candidatus Bathyarchaeia archaeon]